MTKIELTKRGQHLIVTKKVKIAEGNVNSVQLKVDMCDVDVGTITGTAIFSNDAVENGKTYSENLGMPELPGSDQPDFLRRVCTVPHEVLSEDGQLSISLEFVKGDVVEKTTIAKLNVQKSLKHDETVVEPTMNLYLQYLDAIDQRVDPWSTEMRAEHQALMAEHAALFEQRMQELGDFMQGVVLWENPNVSVKFAAQTIELDLSPYKRVEIVSFSRIGDEMKSSTYGRIGDEIRLYGYISSNIIYNRTTIIYEDRIEFGNATSANDNVIPAQIIGYKY